MIVKIKSPRSRESRGASSAGVDRAGISRRNWLSILLVLAVAALAVPLPVAASAPSGFAVLTSASATGGLPLCVVTKNPAPEKPDAPPLWFLPEDASDPAMRPVAAGPRPSAGERCLIISHLVYTLTTSSRL